MLHAAIPALRNASSKLESRSRCFPTPFVRKIFFATNAMRNAGGRCLLDFARCEREWVGRAKSSKNTLLCQSLSRQNIEIGDRFCSFGNSCIQSAAESRTNGQNLPSAGKALWTESRSCHGGNQKTPVKKIRANITYQSTEQSFRNRSRIGESAANARKSFGVKSAPASVEERPFREICTTPSTCFPFPSRIGALMIL
jgi:hypothetical protein